MAEVIKTKFYEMTPIKLGVEVRGLDLSQEVLPVVIEQIKKDVTEHRIMVFKNQSKISGHRHVEISSWFGELESTFYKHPRSPHPDVFRVSNNASEGCTGVGRTGWHIDGSFQESPFAYSLYYMENIPKDGPTTFAPLNEVITGLSPEKLARWERLCMCSDRRGNRHHPLIYSHPRSGKKVLCFHLGMTEAFIWDKDTEDDRLTDWRETVELIKEIHHEFVKDNGAIQYSHKWEKGDFIISDNQAVGHEASPQTQYPVAEVGLRILHRTTIKGTETPVKKYKVEATEQ
ncbi:alpha-ketoglutarate-dependent taurine dioxygenase-like [Amphiura filiformis]|uniref:alpha-ketoglutarate-dependent taurine dioxygenase-like n=1 Tax=Amphiura filiformis TaxID=82378 RepID=UPI003B214437